jgi:hypothetical protein
MHEQASRRRRETLAHVPSRYRGIYERAWEGNSKAAAIKAFCLHCTGDQRNEIRDCTSYACPLREYRPTRPKASCVDVLPSLKEGDSHYWRCTSASENV